MKISYLQDDGGRSQSGVKTKSSDCVTRAIAIASGLPYATIHDMLLNGASGERKVRGKRGSHPSNGNGVHTSRKWFKELMATLGFVFVPTMGIGTGCTVHLREGELPSGRLVVSVSGHYTAVVDGVLHDLHDCSREGNRCVYGYYHQPKAFVPSARVRHIRL